MANKKAPMVKNKLNLQTKAAGGPQNGERKNWKNWTIMVYLAGDNNLSEEMVFALKSMHAAGSTDKIQVVALYDSIGALVPYDIPKLKRKRQSIHPTTYSRVNASPLPLVTEDHGLKQTQETFLRKKDEFSILKIEAAIEHGRRALVIEEEKLIRDRKELNEEKGSAGDEKLQKALLKEGEVSAELREAHRAADLKGFGDASLVRRLRLTGSVVENLKGFVIDSITRYPAHHYGLILSGHGSGAVGDFLTSNKQFLSLSIPGLGKTLRQVRDRFRNFGKPPKEPWLDILGFDSCLMSMAEVAYEVQDCVRFMVGSEGFQANTGWPYDRIIKLLHDNEKLSPRSFASKIVDEHIAYYDDYTAADLSVDIAALDLKQLERLVRKLGGSPKGKNRDRSGLSDLMTDGLENEAVLKTNREITDAILLAHREAQGYKNEQYADLWDFCECLANRTEKISGESALNIGKACRRVQQLIRSALVLRSGYRGAAFQYSHGVSIFFPWAELKDAAEVSELEHYEQLAFAGDTHWKEFLVKYCERTIREHRRQSSGPNGQLRHSFLNCRPGLFTGRPEKDPGAFRTPDDSFRTPDDSFRTPDDSFRTPDDSFRTPDDSFRTPDDSFRSSSPSSPLRIASMKNPPVQWLKLKPGQA